MLADDAEARCIDDLDASVDLIRLAGDQSVDRRLKTELLVDVRHVVDLAVGDEDGAADAGRWHIGYGRRESAEELGRGRLGLLAILCLDDACLDLREAGEPLREVGKRLVGLFAPAGIVLALAAVDDDGGDGRKRLALLLEKHRIGK
ncbi:hypothetical protein ABIA23_001856 [Sinorhizobium fredii]